MGGLIVDATRSSGQSGDVACYSIGVAERTLPSVVTITARGASSGGGTGSGAIIRTDGHIITNDHVISVAAPNGAVEVQFDDSVTVPATIVGRDPLTDLAVLDIDTDHEVTPIPLGSSEEVRVGQPVVALGAPLGLSSTVTAGIVSALDRTVEVPAGNGVTALLIGALQTDASINPGNSGGPLVDCGGRLIGVNTAGASVPNPSGQTSPGSVGLNFAVPVDLALAVADEIIATGTVTHADFGLTALPLPPSVSHPSGVDHGLFVTSVTSGGPAAEAGLRRGDLITELDGQAATTTQQLMRIELTKSPGETVTVTYQRTDQAPITTTLTLGAQSPPGS